jgi:hypothetical protein
VVVTHLLLFKRVLLNPGNMPSKGRKRVKFERDSNSKEIQTKREFVHTSTLRLLQSFANSKFYILS